jgi:hypothetical protein
MTREIHRLWPDPLTHTQTAVKLGIVTSPEVRDLLAKMQADIDALPAKP